MQNKVMQQETLAVARQHAYATFGRLFLEGVTAVTQPYAQVIPELAIHLPTTPVGDDWAAAHFNLFHMNLFPYESIFWGEDGLLGGAVTTAVLAHYHQAGFMDDTAAAPDHIGHELAFLAFLCGTEAEAWKDGLVETAVSIQQRQQTFLTTHLLHWLLPLTITIEVQHVPFYHALLMLTIQLIDDHLVIADNLSNSIREHAPVPDLMADESTRLKDIAAFLLTPLYSGFFMSRDDISRIARSQKLPRGFGSRTHMLTNLIKTAVQHDTLPDLLEQLMCFVQEHETAVMQQIKTFPSLSPFGQHWLTRCAQTHRLLRNIYKQALRP